LGADRLSGEGWCVCGDRPAWAVRYRLETDAEFVTARLSATAVTSGGEVDLQLRRDGEGSWSARHARRTVEHAATNERQCELPELADALDCDLGWSPLTTSLPVLRHGLHTARHDDGPHAFVMAMVTVPELDVVVSRQRYERIGADTAGRAIVRYSRDSGFP